MSQQAAVFERLKAREAQRAADAAKRLEELRVTSDPRESVDVFLQNFHTVHDELDTQITSALGTKPPKQTVDELAARLTELDENIAAASYFLPSYDLRQVSNAAAALRTKLDDLNASIQPKAKFSFSKAKATTSDNNKPTAVGVKEEEKGTTSITKRHPQPPQETPQINNSSLDKTHPQQENDEPVPGLSIKDRTKEVIVMKREDIADQDINLANLNDCTICLLAPLAALFIHGLRNCTLITGPVAGAMYIEAPTIRIGRKKNADVYFPPAKTAAADVEDSIICVASRQVRIHSTQRTDFYLRLLSNPIIEHTTTVRFAPYSPTYQGWQQDFEKHGLLFSDNGKWSDVHDFNWLRTTKSPNWEIVPENERKQVEIPE